MDGKFYQIPRALLLVLIGVVIVDVAIASLRVNVHTPAFRSGLLLGFLTAQVGLHAVWLVLGSAPWFLRALTTLPVAGMAWWYLRAPERLFEVFFIQWCLIATVLFAMRLGGYGLIRELGVCEHPPAAARQYSLRDLVVFVTLTSLIAGLAVKVRPISGRPYSVLAEEILFGLLFSMTTFCPFAAVLGMRKPLLPVLFVLFAAGGLGVVLVGWRGSVETPAYVALFVAPTALQTAVLVVCRWQGYRFRRISRVGGSADLAATP